MRYIVGALVVFAIAIASMSVSASDGQEHPSHAPKCCPKCVLACMME